MADSFNKEAFTLLGVGILIIGVRTFTRCKAVKSVGRLAADDYLMLLAAVGDCTLQSLCYTHVVRMLQLTSLSDR